MTDKPNTAEVMQADRAGNYEKAYFERGMLAAYAWMVTKRRSDKLSDAVLDHAWEHRDEGMGPTECLPTRFASRPDDRPVSEVRETRRWRAALQDIADAEAIPNDAVAFVWCREVAATALCPTSATEREA